MEDKSEKNCAVKEKEGEKRMAKIKDMDKWCPLRRAKQFAQAFLKLDAKRFSQTFLKFDTWCESMRGRSANKKI